MPIPGGARYRMRPMKGGGYERLAFQGNNIVETKNMKSGATHTPAEFAADRNKRRQTRSSARRMTRG
jgi:hypothetical protein